VAAVLGGLSIVRSVATAHGGTATARALEDGGLDVTVELAASKPGEYSSRPS
jgi:signal transduction histidine kinase